MAAIEVVIAPCETLCKERPHTRLTLVAAPRLESHHHHHHTRHGLDIKMHSPPRPNRTTCLCVWPSVPAFSPLETPKECI